MVATLVQFETFVRVAARGNFTRAAEDLHLTQPAVTQQIRALERHFGVQLVEVIGRRPVLTDAGRFLVARAWDVLGSVASLERDMREFVDARAGELHVGATLTIGNYALPELLARFALAYPGVTVRVDVANTATMAARVRSQELGLAMVEGPLDGDDLEIAPYQDDRLLLVVPPHHRFAHRAEVAPRELDGEPFVWREAGSGTRRLTEEALATVGVTPRIVLELPSGESIARAVEAGLGLAILSAIVVERARADGRLTTATIASLDLRRTFRLIRLCARTPSPAARAFMAVAREGYPPASNR